jgi:hypothetical protein
MAYVRYNLYHLERNELNPIPITAPINFENEMRLLAPSYTIISSNEDFQPINAFFDSYAKKDSNKIYDTMSDFYELFNELFFYGNYNEAPDEDKIQETIDKYIEKKKNRDEILQEYAKAIAESIQNAANKEQVTNSKVV